MKLFLASMENTKQYPDIARQAPYILESFVYFEPWMVELISSAKEFLLDSGAFTFLSQQGGNVDFEKYLYKYITFINQFDIKHFFELDVDSVVGLKEVERYRGILERETGKRCIPVWHRSRGKQYYIDLTKEYQRIAIGGIAIKDINRREWKYFPWFLDTAHKNGCKVHGLGFTAIKELSLYPFDSVDSSSWKSGGRFGSIYEFRHDTLKLTSHPNRRVKDYNEADKHNLREWIKFQNYLDKRGL